MTVLLPVWVPRLQKYEQRACDVVDGDLPCLFSKDDQDEMGFMSVGSEAFWFEPQTYGWQSDETRAAADVTTVPDCKLLFLNLFQQAGGLINPPHQPETDHLWSLVERRSVKRAQLLDLGKDEVRRLHNAGHPTPQKLLDFIIAAVGRLPDMGKDEMQRKVEALTQLVKEVHDGCARCRSFAVHHVTPGTVVGKICIFNEEVCLDLVCVHSVKDHWVLSLVDRSTKYKSYTVLDGRKAVDAKAQTTRST